jgi:uncharacterized membrane protein (Fun14 family)
MIPLLSISLFAINFAFVLSLSLTMNISSIMEMIAIAIIIVLIAGKHKVMPKIVTHIMDLTIPALYFKSQKTIINVNTSAITSDNDKHDFSTVFDAHLNASGI